MGKRSIVMLAMSLALLSCPAAAQNRHGFGVVTGAGYATFDAGGSPGDNLYWVSAVGGPGKVNRGLWYADVFIGFPSGAFDFEALYTVDCMFVDRRTKEAWIDGTIIESNSPARIGLKATLYLKDGGPGGEDQHGITPLEPGGPTCDERPEPAFRETAQSGNYIIH